MCKPLCEDEFRNAIAENYYSLNKFHFGLSYEQVIKLIHLFYSRKINIKQSKALGMPNKIIEKFESDASDDVCLTKTEAYFKCRSDEYSREENNEVRRKLAPHQTSMDSPMLYKRPASTMRMQHTAANTGRESKLSYSQNSYTETLSSQRCSVSLPHDHIAFRHFSIEKQPSTTKEIEYKPFPLHSSCYMSNLHNKVAPILMGPNHYSSPDTVAGELSCSRPNIMPRLSRIQEEDAFTSLHVMNDLSPQTEIAQHTLLSGAHPNQVFKFPDYVPLVEESQQKHRENYNSYLDDSEYSPTTGLNSYIPSACKDIFKHYYCSADGYSDDDDELKTYQRVKDDEYNVVGSSLHADSDLSRTSVFSRLSGHQKICNHESPEPSFGEQLGGLSLDQFLNILSTRRSGWSSMEVSKQFDWDSNEQHGSIGLFDHRSGHQNEITQLPVQPVERSEIDQCEAITDPEHVRFTSSLDSDLNNDMIAEESFELPFYNFRRRNTSQKYEVQDDSDKYGDMCGNEAKLSKSKRRRIVRPSLYEEMHQHMNPEVEETISAQMKEQTEVEMSAQTILESKNESKSNTVHRFLDSVVPVLQTVRKYEPVGDLLEQNHVTSVVESLDFIPID